MQAATEPFSPLHKAMAVIQCAANASLDTETTLADALHATPELLAACMRAWDPHFLNIEGPGLLRTMRLVSTSVGQTVLKAISRFSLGLREEGIFREASPSLRDLESMVRLLQHSHLKTFTVQMFLPRRHHFPQGFDYEDGGFKGLETCFEFC